MEKIKLLVAIAVVGHEELSEEKEKKILNLLKIILQNIKLQKKFCNDYPRTKNGKVLRKQLVKQLHEQYHAIEAGEEIIEYKAKKINVICSFI